MSRMVFIGSQSMFLTISRLIYCFDFSPLPGHPIPVGKPLSISIDGPPFKVNITLRSPAHEELIRRECASAVLSGVADVSRGPDRVPRGCCN